MITFQLVEWKLFESNTCLFLKFDVRHLFDKMKNLVFKVFLIKVNKKFDMDIYSKILVLVQMGMGLSLAKGILWIYLVSVQVCSHLPPKQRIRKEQAVPKLC